MACLGVRPGTEPVARLMRVLPVVLFALLSWVSRSSAEKPVSLNETVRLLSGLPGNTKGLDHFRSLPAWSAHAVAFDRAWKEFEGRQLAGIRSWGQANLGSAFSNKSPLFYLFSGPDALYAQAFYPNAQTYVLAGLEPVGSPPDVSLLSPAALEAGLLQLRNSVDTAFSFSFFKTKNMKEDLSKAELGGTLPILAVFLARLGNQIRSAELVAIDKNGAFGSGSGTTPGVKITFFRPRNREQTLYYFSTNLADDSVESNPGFLRFCEKQGQGNSLLKAASYLIHSGGFNHARDFLLAFSDTLVQDDSGIPYRYFAPAKWELRCFGCYAGPIDLFKERYQPDLAQEFVRQAGAPLPFSFGYRWHPKESGLLLAKARR